ncbi:MAG TPA: hypothetical protein VJX66_29395 [Amycolatopsis sp.]|nr:hypothetical protein [Amycolatopsis sp.]
MTVRSQRSGGVIDEVSVWLAGEFTGRLPYEVIDRVIRRTWQDVDGRIATEELGEMLHRLARSRLYRILDGNEIQIPQSR